MGLPFELGCVKWCGIDTAAKGVGVLDSIQLLNRRFLFLRENKAAVEYILGNMSTYIYILQGNEKYTLMGTLCLFSFYPATTGIQLRNIKSEKKDGVNLLPI